MSVWLKLIRSLIFYQNLLFSWEVGLWVGLSKCCLNTIRSRKNLIMVTTWITGLHITKIELGFVGFDYKETKFVIDYLLFNYKISNGHW